MPALYTASKADEDIGLTHREHAIPGELYDENRSPFIDWNRSELYELQRGEGECAI